MSMQLLKGIRVIEIGTHVAIPLTARIMADWGAEVIKIEMPGGERGRTTGRLAGIPQGDGENVMFTITNSGKEMVSLDLKTKEGKDVLFRLLENADVFLSNIRWNSIERLGLDYETLHDRFPGLIYLHFTGFGYNGPDAHRPGFDNVAFFAATGLLADYPQIGDRPMMPFNTYGDAITASSILSGIMAALFHRERTGQGLRLTTSLYAAGIWSNYYNIVACQEAYGKYQMPRNVADNTNPLGEIYQCSDGRWILLSADQRQFRRLMNAMELYEAADDPRFQSFELIAENHTALFSLMTERFLTRSSEEWEERFIRADVLYQKLIHAREVSRSKQAWVNGYLSEVTMKNGVRAVVPNPPVQFFGMNHSATQVAHSAGADTRAVLERYGYSPDEISSLIKRGIALESN